MARFEKWSNTELTAEVHTTELISPLFTEDNLAHRIGVHLYKNNIPYEFGNDATVKAYAMLPDGTTTVEMDGEVSGSDVYVDLAQEVYSLPGRVIIAIRVTEGETISVVGAYEGYVRKSTNESVIIPGNVITDPGALLDKFEELQELEEQIQSDAEAIQYLSDLRTDVTNLKRLNPADDLFDIHQSRTHNGVTFTWDATNGQYNISGASSGTSIANMVNTFLPSVTSEIFPTILQPGHRYWIEIDKNIDAYCYVSFYATGKTSNDSPDYWAMLRGSAFIELPSNTGNVMIQVRTSCTTSQSGYFKIALYDNGYTNKTLSNFVDERSVIASTGDQTTRDTEIRDKLNENGYCVLGPGDFYVANITMPEGTTIVGSGIGVTRLFMSTGVTGNCITMGHQCSVSELSIYGQSSAEGIPGSNLGRHALAWIGTYEGPSTPGTYPKHGAAHDLYIEGFDGAAVYCYRTSMEVNSGIQIENVTAFKCWCGVYIPQYSEFNQFTNIRITYCTIGCWNNGGNNIFENCNFSKNYVGLRMDDTNGAAPNNSHGSFVGCIFNHSGNNNDGYSLDLTGLDNGEIFSACQIFYGKTKIVSCTGIRFVGCNFGASTDIGVSDSSSIEFDSCQFKTTYDSPLTQSNNVGLRFIGCTTYDGNPFDPTNMYGQYTVHDGYYINKTSGVITASANYKVISVHVAPYTTYQIRKNTASTLRAGAFSGATVAAGDALINVTTHEEATTDPVTVYTNRYEYLYIQLWAATDNDNLKNVEAHMPSLTITPMDNGSLGIIESLKSALGDASSDYTEIQNLFINTSINKIASPSSSYAENTKEHRLISMPIVGGKRYRIWCDVLSNMAAGAGNVSTPIQSQEMKIVSQNNGTSKFFDIDTTEDDSYLYIQTFTNANSSIYAPQYYVNRMLVYPIDKEPRSLLPYDGEDIVEINHRGLHDEAPENTIPAFRLSKKDGYTWFECDVQVTADGVPVICHDATINRTARNADGTSIESTVTIGSTNYEDLLDYDFGIAMGEEYAGTKIPTLEETMDFARKAGLKVAIELKNDTVNETNFPDIYSIVRAYAMESHVEFFSGSIGVAKVAANAVKNGIVGLATNSTTIMSAVTNLRLLKVNNNIVRLHADPTDDPTVQAILDQVADEGFEIIFRGHTLAQIALAPDYAHMFISNNLHPKAVLYEDAMDHEMPLMVVADVEEAAEYLGI